LPVAKRNFLLRHGHGLFQTSKELKEEVDEVCASPLHEQSCQRCEEGSSFLLGNLRTTTVEKPGHRRVVSFDAKKRLDSRQLDATEHAWLHLLHQRPDLEDEDQSKNAEWMDKILKFSEQLRATALKRPSLTTVNAPLPLPVMSTAPAEPSPSPASINVTMEPEPFNTGPMPHDANAASEVAAFATLFEEVDILNFFDNSNEQAPEFGLGIETEKL
jgi:hypothetical protein